MQHKIARPCSARVILDTAAASLAMKMNASRSAGLSLIVPALSPTLCKTIEIPQAVDKQREKHKAVLVTSTPPFTVVDLGPRRRYCDHRTL